MRATDQYGLLLDQHNALAHVPQQPHGSMRPSCTSSDDDHIFGDDAGVLGCYAQSLGQETTNGENKDRWVHGGLLKC